jgi:nucleoside-diphosphate-sugar epimerase
MRLLVLGGTGWLGSAIVTTALAGGHEVTCLTRGSGIPDGATHVTADRDELDALTAVTGARWDAVIDVARQPGHVRRAARALEPVAERYLFVSSCSVYASQALVGGDETVPTLEPLEADTMATGADYGAAKVACERAVLEAFGDDRSLIARAGLIGGPGDPTGRSTYWPWRFAHPSNTDGAVLVPDAPELPTAIIDVRDLARWLVDSAAGDTAGVFNAMGHPHSMPAHLAAARAAAGHTGQVVAAAEPWLLEHEVAEWSGTRSLPLWLADPEWYGMNARSIDRALAVGLSLRPLDEMLRDILTSQLAAPIGAGLSDVDERALLAAATTE